MDATYKINGYREMCVTVLVYIIRHSSYSLSVASWNMVYEDI